MPTAGRVLWSQGVAQQGVEAMWVRLGAAVGQPQAELDGFKSRALRAEVRSQRHLYASEWRAVEVAAGGEASFVVLGGALVREGCADHLVQDRNRGSELGTLVRLTSLPCPSPSPFRSLTRARGDAAHKLAGDSEDDRAEQRPNRTSEAADR